MTPMNDWDHTTLTEELQATDRRLWGMLDQAGIAALEHELLQFAAAWDTQCAYERKDHPLALEELLATGGEG